MHVTHLETGRHIYGGARQVLMLLDGLAAAGVQNTLICPDDSAIATAVDASHTQVVRMPMQGDLDIGFVGRLGRWLAAQQPDLIHVHSRRGADLWGGLASRPAGLKAVLTRRVDNPEVPFLGALKYRMYDRVIAISGAIHAQLLADGADEAKTRVVHSAINPAACQPSWTREQFLAAFDCEPGNTIVVCVAQFIERKGHAWLLQGWSDIAERFPDARLLLFGQGRLEDGLRQQVADGGLQDSIHFCGFRDDLRSFLGCADMLVHPALREGLGICLLEAQAAGLPVVAARAGGIPEAVDDGKTGVLVEPGKPGVLAAALADLLVDGERRALLAAAGPDYVAQHFSPAAMVSGNLAVYKELLT